MSQNCANGQKKESTETYLATEGLWRATDSDEATTSSENSTLRFRWQEPRIKDRSKCSARHCGAWRDVLHDGNRSNGRRGKRNVLIHGRKSNSAGAGATDMAVVVPQRLCCSQQ